MQERLPVNVHSQVRFAQALKMHFKLLPVFAAIASAAVTITDPSDVINPADWASDNAILAVYNITPTLYQTNAIVGPYLYSGKDVNITQQYLAVNANDTSVLVITESSTASVKDTEVVKFGYGSNLFQQSFYGKQHCFTAWQLLKSSRSQRRGQCRQCFDSIIRECQYYHPQWSCQYFCVW